MTRRYAVIRHRPERWLDEEFYKKFNGGVPNRADITPDNLPYPYPDVFEGTDKPVSGSIDWVLDAVAYAIFNAFNSVTSAFETWRLGAYLVNRDRNQHLYGHVVGLHDSYLPDSFEGMAAHGDPPLVQGIMFGGGTVEVLERKNGAVRVACYKAGEIPLDASPSKHPEKWHIASSVGYYDGKKYFGEIGYTPRGIKTIVPLVSRTGSMWIRETFVDYTDKVPSHPEWEEVKMHNEIHLQGVDISYWQNPYKDDGIDEGVKLDTVMIKVADGLISFADPNSWTYKNYWKVQYDSIAPLPRHWMYHWYQTEVQFDPVDQANVALGIVAEFYDVLDVYVVDFESHQNVINSVSIRKLSYYVKTFKQGTDKKLAIYTNWSIYRLILAEMGAVWCAQQNWFFAGGKYYNAQMSELPEEEYFDALFNVPGRIAVQWSADGNRMADEADFGTSETASIDRNHLYFTAETYDVWLGKVEVPVDPLPVDPPWQECDEVKAYSQGVADTLMRYDAVSDEIIGELEG